MVSPTATGEASVKARADTEIALIGSYRELESWSLSDDDAIESAAHSDASSPMRNERLPPAVSWSYVTQVRSKS
ncbi:hypothetical protein D3C87_1936770 [compost metagenome]